MARNTLSDLNNHLFEQMERLNDDSLSDEALTKEISRSRAMKEIAQNIIGNAGLILKANELKRDYGENVKSPNLLE